MSATFTTSGRSSRLKLSLRFQASPSLYSRLITTLNQTPDSPALAQTAALIRPSRTSCAGLLLPLSATGAALWGCRGGSLAVRPPDLFCPIGHLPCACGGVGEVGWRDEWGVAHVVGPLV